MEIELVDKCPECGCQNLISDEKSGEIICSDCGLVVGEIVNRGPEWRAFTLKEQEFRTRVGPPQRHSIHDKGLSTDMIPLGRDAHGRRIHHDTYYQMWRLRKLQRCSRVHSSIDRNLIRAMQEIDFLSEKLSIPLLVKEQAAIIYRKALEKRLVRGRVIAVMAVACLYLACRITKTLRTLREISDVSSIDRKEIGRCYRLLLRELDIKVFPNDPISYVSKIAKKIGASGVIQGRAVEILGKAKEKGMWSGKGRGGLSAAALYIACLQKEENVTQEKIAKTAQITEVTLRNRYRELIRELGLKLPPTSKCERKTRSLFFWIWICLFGGATSSHLNIRNSLLM